MKYKGKAPDNAEQQTPSKGGEQAVVKVDAEDLIDQKMNLDTSAQEDVDKLMKTVAELQKNIAKVIEDDEDKQQLDIDDSIAKAQRLKDEMGEALKSARNAKLAGFPAAR